MMSDSKMSATDILFSLIRSELCGAPIDSDAITQIDEEMLAQLYHISDSHDIAHIVASSLSKSGLLGDDEVSAKFKKKLFLAVYRYEHMNHELAVIYKVLEEKKIAYLPLKGAVIREYYPEPWMRTSCDADILVKKEDIKKATETLKGELGYTSDDKMRYHDISLYSETGVHIELHFSIKENNDVFDKVLERAWEHTLLPDDKKSRYSFTNEYLFFHTAAHIAYHILDGGCGIRPVLDVWLMRQKIKADESTLGKLLETARLSEFFEQVKNLSDVWLLKKEHSDITRKLEEFILEGGVYGTLENSVGMAKIGKGKFEYMFSRIFMPYRKLMSIYPIIEKHPVLYPYYQLVRWKRILSKNGHKAVSELRYNNTIDDEKMLKFGEICRELGIK